MLQTACVYAQIRVGDYPGKQINIKFLFVVLFSARNFFIKAFLSKIIN